MEIGKGDVARAIGALHVYHRIQRRQRHAHVGRMRGNAVRTGAQDGVVFGQAANRRTAGAGRTLVARRGAVVEIHAAGALQQVAAIAGHVADLWRGTGQNRRAQQRVACLNLGVIGGVGIACECTQTQTARRVGGDLAQWQAVDVHQLAGPHQLQLHQVSEVGAAGDQAYRRFGRDWLRISAARGDRADCRVHALRACVAERNHAGTVPGVQGVSAESLLSEGVPNTSITASVICG